MYTKYSKCSYRFPASRICGGCNKGLLCTWAPVWVSVKWIAGKVSKCAEVRGLTSLGPLRVAVCLHLALCTLDVDIQQARARTVSAMARTALPLETAILPRCGQCGRGAGLTAGKDAAWFCGADSSLGRRTSPSCSQARHAHSQQGSLRAPVMRGAYLRMRLFPVRLVRRA